jgi:phenylalanyl-tRNA synthetase beta chain
MRTSLIPGLLANVSRAARHQRSSGRIFEIGKTYRASATAPADETLHLGIAIFGTRGAWMGEGEPVDFFDGKGAIEEIFAGVGLSVSFALPSDATTGWAHPKRVAAVVFQGAIVGHIAEAHPDVCDAHDLTARPILAEFTLEPALIARAAVGPRQVAALPRFQPVIRDFSLEVPENIAFGDIETAVKIAGGALVASVHVFDVYRGPGIAADKKSLALRITYRDPEATLTDKRVEDTQAKQLEALKQLGVTLRA